MDIAALQAFMLVAEHQSFSRAAEATNLTQPAISKRISVLEKSLGTKLFDRIGKHVSLTPAGTALLPMARKILWDIEQSQTVIKNLSDKVEGTLSIVTSHHIGLHRLPLILKSFRETYPNIQLDLQFMASEEASQVVIHGDIEIGIVTLPSTAHKELNSVNIWQDHLTIAINADHHLSRTAITLQELADMPCIVPTQNTYTRDLIDKVFTQHSLTLNVALETNYLETIKMMVHIGMGWSALPSIMLDDSLATLQTKYFPVQRSLGVIHHQQRTLSNAATAFIDYLQSNVTM